MMFQRYNKDATALCRAETIRHEYSDWVGDLGAEHYVIRRPSTAAPRLFFEYWLSGKIQTTTHRHLLLLNLQLSCSSSIPSAWLVQKLSPLTPPPDFASDPDITPLQRVPDRGFSVLYTICHAFTSPANMQQTAALRSCILVWRNMQMPQWQHYRTGSLGSAPEWHVARISSVLLVAVASLIGWSADYIRLASFFGLFLINMPAVPCSRVITFQIRSSALFSWLLLLYIKS